MPMSVDSRKNDLYMSWSSDGESSENPEAAPPARKESKNQIYSCNNTGHDVVAPVSPSEAPSSPAQVEFFTYSGDEEEGTAVVGELEKGEERGGTDPWKKVAIVLVLAVLGVVLYLWLGNKATNNTNAARSPPDGPTSNQNSDISSSSAPATAATTSPEDTSMPSLAPTAPRIFDPPSAEDCIAIARGQTLEGQDKMMVETYEVVLDVAFDSGGLPIDGILNRMASEIRKIVLPEILGCGDADRRLMEIEGMVDDNPSAPSIISSLFRGGNNQRLLSASSLPPSSRYIMANAAVSVRNPSGEWCAAGSGPLCYRVIVSFDIAFRSDNLKVLSVIEFIAEAFKTPDSSLLDKLLLGLPFQNIFVRDVYPAFHTAIPTASPSHY